MRALSALFFLLASLTFGHAQTPLNIGDAGTPTRGPLQLYNFTDWRTVLTPQQCPNGVRAPLNTCGDGRDDFHFQWDSFSGHFELRPTSILGGPGVISSATSMGGSLLLTQNAWNNLYGPVNGQGFRQGMTAFIPVGNYNGRGQVAVATGGTANTTRTIRTLMGTCRKSSGLQQGILTVPGADGSIVTNGATAAGAVNGVNNVLSFASTTCIAPGMTVYDVSHSTAVPSRVVVCAVDPIHVTLTADTAYPVCNASGFVTAPGVSNGDAFMFGYVIGYGGPKTWPGAGGFSETIPFGFTTFANIGCLGALNSNDQCEVLVQIYTDGAGDSIQVAGGAVTTPPYPTSFDIWRMDGGYGGK